MGATFYLEPVTTYPEKVRIVEQMRAAAREIKAAVRRNKTAR
jgi:hypothetical protein